MQVGPLIDTPLALLFDFSDKNNLLSLLEIPEHRNSLEAIKSYKRPSIRFAMPGDLPSNKERQIERADEDTSRDVVEGDTRDVKEAKVENIPVALERHSGGK